MTYHEKAFLAALAVFGWFAAINQISAALGRTTRSRWLWWFRPYRRWYLAHKGRWTIERLEQLTPVLAAREIEQAAADLAHNPRFLRDMGLAVEPMAGIDELIESAIDYCPECPLQGACSVCGSYHGPEVRE